MMRDAPGVLGVDFEVRKAVLALGTRRGLGVVVEGANKRVGVGIVGVVGIVRTVVTKRDRAAGGRVRGLVFARALDVRAEFVGMGAGNLADVFHHAEDGVAVVVRQAVAERWIRGIGPVERDVGDQIGWVERWVPLRKLNAGSGPRDGRRILRVIEQFVLADAENEFVEHRR